MIDRLVLAGSQLGLIDQSDISLLEAFREMGCRVEAFDYRATTFVPRWLSRLAPPSLRRFSPRRLAAVSEADDAASNERFLGLIERVRPQLVMALQAERLSASTLLRAQKTGAVLMNWMHDEPEGRVDPRVVPLYDCWLVWDASVSSWLKERGARRVEHLPVACDPKRHYPVSLSDSEKRLWACSLCFVGSFQPNRAQMLSAVADLGLGIWGPGWRQAGQAELWRCIRGAVSLSREQWLKAYAASEIVINVHSQGRDGLNLRVWEALGAGACLISDYRADMERFLKGSVATFTTPQELRQLCQELLANAGLRQEMRQEGRRRVLSEHTFKQRAQQILAWAAQCQVGVVR